MKKILVAAAIFTLFSSLALRAQSGLYLPTAKPVKDMRAALTNPQAFYLLLSYQGSDSTYNITHLDLLDSAYRIAFSEENPMLYTMVVESYAGATPSKPSASRCLPPLPSTTAPPSPPNALN